MAGMLLARGNRHQRQIYDYCRRFFACGNSITMRGKEQSRLLFGKRPFYSFQWYNFFSDMNVAFHWASQNLKSNDRKHYTEVIDWVELSVDASRKKIFHYRKGP